LQLGLVLIEVGLMTMASNTPLKALIRFFGLLDWIDNGVVFISEVFS
jgi:hypothetical protein